MGIRPKLKSTVGTGVLSKALVARYVEEEILSRVNKYCVHVSILGADRMQNPFV